MAQSWLEKLMPFPFSLPTNTVPATDCCPCTYCLKLSKINKQPKSKRSSKHHKYPFYIIKKDQTKRSVTPHWSRNTTDSAVPEPKQPGTSVEPFRTHDPSFGTYQLRFISTVRAILISTPLKAPQILINFMADL